MVTATSVYRWLKIAEKIQGNMERIEAEYGDGADLSGYNVVDKIQQETRGVGSNMVISIELDEEEQALVDSVIAEC